MEAVFNLRCERPSFKDRAPHGSAIVSDIWQRPEVTQKVSAGAQNRPVRGR
jgi:hypothetical protein